MKYDVKWDIPLKIIFHYITLPEKIKTIQQRQSNIHSRCWTDSQKSHNDFFFGAQNKHSKSISQLSLSFAL